MATFDSSSVTFDSTGETFDSGGESAPAPADVNTGVIAWPRRVYHAAARPFEEPDEFGRPVARPIVPARVAYPPARDYYATAIARCMFRAARCRGLPSADEFVTPRARRGLPARALLEQFLNHMT